MYSCIVEARTGEPYDYATAHWLSRATTPEGLQRSARRVLRAKYGEDYGATIDDVTVRCANLETGQMAHMPARTYLERLKILAGLARGCRMRSGLEEVA